MMTTSTIDIGKYGNHLLSGSDLEDFLTKGIGGNSVRTLQSICNLNDSELLTFMIPHKDTLPTSYAEICGKLLERVSDQPALVSAFKVFNELKNQGHVSFSSSSYEVGSDGVSNVMHSMVLIGARKSSLGEYFFLLQNWWEGKYFIEVSGEYMHRCSAMITFVRKTITRKQEMSDYVMPCIQKRALMRLRPFSSEPLCEI